MRETTKIKIKIFVAGALFIMALLVVLADEAKADGYNHATNNYITNNYITEVTDVSSYRVTDQLSASDLNQIIGGGLAGGAHQFDWSTTRWQLSITGATTTSDWDQDTNFSFAIGKRFGKESWVPNALWHLAYTPDIAGQDYISGGATIVLDE